MKKTNFIVPIVIVGLIIISIINDGLSTSNNSKTKFLKILSSYENYELESQIKSYASKNNILLNIKYMGDLDIVDELNLNSDRYDAVWISNSMWLYMLENSYLTSNSKSISISPVVVGIRKSKAKELDLIDKEITNNDILNLIQNKKIKYVMSSVTKTNTGATAYLGFLNSLAGNPEVLTSEMLQDENLINNLIDVFSGVERVSGDEDYLEEMFLKNDNYEAVIADESSLININKSLSLEKKEELYLLYPVDGVAVNDSTFAFLNKDEEKQESFLKIQSYLLSDEGQEMLKEKGRRTWYGGVSEDINKDLFNKEWGIDTTKYLNVTRFPSKDIITEAINLYIERLRKPTHVVFCLDYSGSMYNNGEKELKNAMKYILSYEDAKKDKLQFSIKDKITVITFSSKVTNIWNAIDGHNTDDLINKITRFGVDGTTALYDAVIEGINILDNDSDEYTKTVIAMTDGRINVGTLGELTYSYKKLKNEIPVYSIMFGSAEEEELEDIAKLTNAKVFDGRVDLLQAFKEVRSYN